MNTSLLWVEIWKIEDSVFFHFFLRIVENALWDKATFTISLLPGSCYFIHRYAFCGTFAVGKCMYVERNKEKLCKAKTKNTADKDACYMSKVWWFVFYLGWSGSILHFRQNMTKVGSKTWLPTCSSIITLSLPSYTGSALKRGLKFCNEYLSLLYFCCRQCTLSTT